MAISTERQFLDQWQQAVQDAIYSNTSRDISGDEVRDALIGLKNSTTQEEAGLGHSTSPAATINLTAAWTVISNATLSPVIAYDLAIGGDADFLKIDQAAGTITSKDVDGWSYEALGAITINSGNNEVIEAAIGVDGVPGELIASNVGAAGVRPKSLFLRRYLTSTPANSAFSIIVRAPDGTANNVEITNRTFGLISLPTNNP